MVGARGVYDGRHGRGCQHTPLLRGRAQGLPAHPGGNPGANLKSISHICHPILVAFVWELTKETSHLPLGCLQGGADPASTQSPPCPPNRPTPLPRRLTLCVTASSQEFHRAGGKVLLWTSPAEVRALTSHLGYLLGRHFWEVPYSLMLSPGWVKDLKGRGAALPVQAYPVG